jgi:hypothetical protein
MRGTPIGRQAVYGSSLGRRLAFSSRAHGSTLDVAVRAAAEPWPGDVDRAVRQARDRLAVHVLVGDDGIRRRDVPHLLLRLRDHVYQSRDPNDGKKCSLHVISFVIRS